MSVKQCVKCGELNHASLESCVSCNASLSDAVLIDGKDISIATYQSPEALTPSCKRIGGWLILVILGLIISILRIGSTLINSYIPLLSSDLLDILSNPKNKYYSKLWIPFITFETIGNILMMILCITALILMLKKKKVFPKVMIAFYTFNLLFIIADSIFYRQVKAPDSIDYEQGTQILRQFVTCCIWIPYFCLSRRVKNTFTK